MPSRPWPPSSCSFYVVSIPLLLLLTSLAFLVKGEVQVGGVDEPVGGHHPEVIGHRGAPYFLPEHTLASYEMAMRQGADWIEPDLCFTSDGHLIAVHDLDLGSVTDIGERSNFQGRNRSILLPNGRPLEGYITSDFTLAEVKTLRVKQRVPSRGHRFDGIFQVPTLDEILELVSSLNKQLELDVGVYIETKHPSYFAEIGFIHDTPLLSTLKAHGFVTEGTQAKEEKVIIQSFESTNLIRLRKVTSIRLVLLLDYVHLSDYPTPEDTDDSLWKFLTVKGVVEAATFVDAIGPHKSTLLQETRYSTHPDVLVGKELVRICSDVGLQLHPYTFRNHYEDKSLARFEDDPIQEYKFLMEMGVQFFFTENAGMALCARHEYEAKFLPEKRGTNDHSSSRSLSTLKFGDTIKTLSPELLYVALIATGAIGLFAGALLGMYITHRSAKQWNMLQSKRFV
eukprot:TRINITY_DN8952_c0_g1_i1.p1 TRINITY_DN8952_c0_g1~~TRINITY_DN8952_c0_g1_i1.p1  ORF type:complete len:462 (+),score=63.64 TRINITY_DN8952_c0_g1_i1:29-1387(+)